MLFRWPWNRQRDRRRKMIDETGAFLTAALDSRVRLPRIPRRSVHHGGYGDLLKRPGARAAVNRWWALALEAVATVCDDA